MYASSATTVPGSSTKGSTGHALGAAGHPEALIAALAIRHGLAPGGLNTAQPDPVLSTRYLLSNRIRRIESACRTPSASAAPTARWCSVAPTRLGRTFG